MTDLISKSLIPCARGALPPRCCASFVLAFARASEHALASRQRRPRENCLRWFHFAVDYFKRALFHYLIFSLNLIPLVNLWLMLLFKKDPPSWSTYIQIQFLAVVASLCMNGRELTFSYRRFFSRWRICWCIWAYIGFLFRLVEGCIGEDKFMHWFGL